MIRQFKFSFVLDQIEQMQLATIAASMQRTRSDCMRFLIREAARGLHIEGSNPQITQPEEDVASV